MINRRHIRVKVMQAVYAMHQSQNDDLIREEKLLKLSVDKMQDMYVLLLSMLVEVRDMERIFLEVSSKKILATKEEKNPNVKFINNKVIQLLNESNSLALFIDEHKLNNWYLDTAYVKDIWKTMKESDFYIAYMANEKDSFELDKEFIVRLFREIVAPNEKIADYFEDKNISWVDDIPFVNTWVAKTLNQLTPLKGIYIGSLYKDEDDQKYVSDLFRKTVLNDRMLSEEVDQRTPNWDMDRIADVDLILIKMAICEFLKFPSIPTRVTINEYIEIAKDYSTEKSSFFINGVLDKISKEFEKSKRLNKIGRGLL
ncbi:MAG: transcription antitermination factor NusB [Flavobacteriaceae bacterium]|nr:MAG: transcription antitermination factor NusB [Flavobacteriaceae bacterium]